MRVSFEISDKDIGHFRECMKRARDAVKDADESDIIEAARGMFDEIRGARAPAFIKDRVHRLESMTQMLQDEEWHMPDGPRDRVLRALVYFCDPEDLIPDSIPGIGYLDDAIMIELVLRELKALRRSGRVLELGQGTRYDPYLYTGCEVLSASSASPWLRKVRPWVNVANS